MFAKRLTSVAVSTARRSVSVARNVQPMLCKGMTASFPKSRNMSSEVEIPSLSETLSNELQVCASYVGMLFLYSPDSYIFLNCSYRKKYKMMKLTKNF